MKLEIYTKFCESDADEFNKIRQMRWKWTFLKSGEWSQDWYHQGTNTFFFGITPDKKFFAILWHKFTREIIATAGCPGKHSYIEIATAMCARIHKDGGPYIEIAHREGVLGNDKI